MEEQDGNSLKRDLYYGILEPGKRKIDGAIKGEMLLFMIMASSRQTSLKFMTMRG
jgi:hypothetical protein